jgi:hypothetical protein
MAATKKMEGCSVFLPGRKAGGGTGAGSAYLINKFSLSDNDFAAMRRKAVGFGKYPP